MRVETLIKTAKRKNAEGMFLTPYAAPSIGAFVETNRQDSRFAGVAPEGRGTGMYRVSNPQGRGRDAARFARGKEAPSENPRQKRQICPEQI